MDKDKLHKTYQKQVEAWKEEMVKYKQKLLAAYKTLNHAVFSGTEIEVDHAEYWAKEIEEEFKDFATSSRHKDTIELLEAIIKEVEGMIGVHFGGKSDPVEYFHDSQGRMKAVEYLKNTDLLTKLQAELTLLKNER